MVKEGGGFLTPKAIGNRIKAKGLQKLRFYCEMCQKQCRDENGFKCHCTSESHQRQMQIFASNPNTFMDEFSVDFEEGMLEIISRRARARIQANHCYQEYIGNRGHVHMNSTMWETLTDFVIYLGRAGKCDVDQTDKGWFIQYVDRDPAKLAAADATSKRKSSELDAEGRRTRELMRVAKRAREEGGEGVDGAVEPAAQELVRPTDAAPLVLQLHAGANSGGAGKRPASGLGGAGQSGLPPRPKAAGFATIDEEEVGGAAGGGGSGSAPPKSAMAAIMEAETRKRQALADKEVAASAASAAIAAAVPFTSGGKRDGWLCCGIVVKCMNGTLAGGRYRKQKGVVRALVDKYVAQVEMADSGDLLSLDQDDLETVLPPVGGALRVVHGAHRGARAKLLEIDESKFCVRIELAEGAHRGAVVGGVEYEDVSKLHVA